MKKELDDWLTYMLERAKKRVKLLDEWAEKQDWDNLETLTEEEREYLKSVDISK